MALLAGCGGVQEDGAAPHPPALDRQSWGVRLDLVQPGSIAHIEARYVAEDMGEEVARGDSGVAVVLADSAGREHTHIQALRLVLDYKARRLCLAGEVQVVAGDSLEARADSLVWDEGASAVVFPDSVRLTVPSGWERCRQLRAGLAMREWSAQDVEAGWQVAGHGGEAHVRALAEHARRDSSLWVDYVQPEVAYAGAVVRSAAARYDQRSARIDFEGQVSGQDSSLTLSARTAGVDLKTRRLVAQGRARLEGSGFGVEAEEVEHSLSDSLVEVRGAPAVYTQGDRRIEAPRLLYDRQAETVQAGGGVQLWDGQRHLRAAELVYQRHPGQARASGGMVLETREMAGSLAAGGLVLDLDHERAELDGAPVLRRVSGAGDSLRVRATSMLLDLKARSLAGRDTFVVESPQVSLQARRGRYQDEGEVLDAEEQVVLVHAQPHDDIRTVVRADSAVVHLQQGAVQRAALPGRVTGWIQSGAGRSLWVEGADAEALFAGRDLQHFSVSRSADATHRDLERDEVSRFGGNRMVMDFGSTGRIERVTVVGDARLEARLRPQDGQDKGALSEISGQELEIRFEDGRMAQVTVDRGIQGRYLPENRRKP